MEIAARTVLVAVIATFCSAAPMILLLGWDMDTASRLSFAGLLLVISILGNFLVGLPISLVAYHFVRRSDRLTAPKLFLLANSVAAVFALVLTALGGLFALIFYGIPILVAANAFAVAGWFIVVKPTHIRA